MVFFQYLTFEMRNLNIIKPYIRTDAIIVYKHYYITRLSHRIRIDTHITERTRKQRDTNFSTYGWYQVEIFVKEQVIQSSFWATVILLYIHLLLNKICDIRIS
ncbi:hypothetical protein D9M68_612480 [compost metagenome]